MYQKRFANLPTSGVGFVLFVIVLFGLFISESHAASVTFSGTNGILAASVTFQQLGDDLQVTLVNTSTYDLRQPSDVLTAVFFTLAGNPTLTPVSAVISSNSTVLFGGTDPGGVVGGEWAYKNHLWGAPHGAVEGISSSGLGLFGPQDRFPGSNLQGPVSPDGLQYGITSAGDNPAIGNKAVTGANALIKDAVVFEFSGLPTNYVLSASSICSLSFQYGTSLCGEPDILGHFTSQVPPQTVPEPGTMTLAAVGFLLAAVLNRGSRQRR